MADKDFIKTCLSAILGVDASDDIAEYILSIETQEDFEEFMSGIVDSSNPSHVNAYEILRDQQFANSDLKHSSYKPSAQIENIAVIENNESIQRNKSKENVQKTLQNASNSRDIAQKGGNKVNSQKVSNGKGTSQITTNVKESKTISSSANIAKNKGPMVKKKKLKFVDFYAQDQKPGLKKGRHPCNCEAAKHNLINNCTQCGRIVCEQEGSGPCSYCGNMVCTRGEMELLAENSKESDKLYNYLMERSRSKDWKKAVEHRDKLLDIDSMGTASHVVYDDQSDYFTTNNWETEEDKQKAKDRKWDFYHKVHKSKKDMLLCLDLATRTMTSQTDNVIENKNFIMEKVNAYLDSPERKLPKTSFDGTYAQFLANVPNKLDKMRLKETDVEQNSESEDENDANKEEADIVIIPNYNFKIANTEFLEHLDHGMCLSMHQPYASLLVAGIKRHEGRTWSTTHRGRLWIAAASKVPDDEEILACEDMYRTLYSDVTMKFPRRYPQGCLLGFVNVDDCLKQEEYRNKYPDGESNSPYVFICSNPVILPIFFPMAGQHKIFQLKSDIHKRAKAALMAAKWV